MAFSVCFIIQPRTSFPEIVPLMAGLALPCQSLIKKMFHTLGHRQMWWRRFLTGGSFFQGNSSSSHKLARTSISSPDNYVLCFLTLSTQPQRGQGFTSILNSEEKTKAETLCLWQWQWQAKTHHSSTVAGSGGSQPGVSLIPGDICKLQR